MKHAAYPLIPRRKRSRVDHLADRAPGPLRIPAGAVALAIDRMVTAKEKAKTAAGRRAAQVRARPFPFMLAALGIGAGVALLAYGPSRRAIGGTLSRTAGKGIDALSRQLAKELRSLAR